jgi:hypothetical protein
MTYRPIAAAAAFSIGLLLAAMPAPARAEVEYPWCGYVTVFQGQMQSCSFSNLEQCRAFVTTMGYCDRNPRASPGQPPAAVSRRR